MPNISAYVRRWADEVTGEPVIEVRIEGAHDAPAKAMAAAAYAAARVAIVEFCARRRNGRPPTNDGNSFGGTPDPTAPRPLAPGDTGFATMRDELLKEGHTDDDWAKLIEQREKELDAFRRASVELPRYEIGARVPALYPGEPSPELGAWAPWIRSPESEVSQFHKATSGLARVIKDTDVQYVVDALIHAGTALSSLHGLTSIEWPDDPREARFEIDNSRQSALINSALARLGVNPLSDLPVREIHPDSDLPREAGSTDPFEEKR